MLCSRTDKTKHLLYTAANAVGTSCAVLSTLSEDRFWKAGQSPNRKDNHYREWEGLIDMERLKEQAMYTLAKEQLRGGMIIIFKQTQGKSQEEESLCRFSTMGYCIIGWTLEKEMLGSLNVKKIFLLFSKMWKKNLGEALHQDFSNYTGPIIRKQLRNHFTLKGNRLLWSDGLSLKAENMGCSGLAEFSLNSLLLGCGVWLDSIRFGLVSFGFVWV